MTRLRDVVVRVDDDDRVVRVDHRRRIVRVDEVRARARASEREGAKISTVRIETDLMTSKLTFLSEKSLFSAV